MVPTIHSYPSQPKTQRRPPQLLLDSQHLPIGDIYIYMAVGQSLELQTLLEILDRRAPVSLQFDRIAARGVFPRAASRAFAPKSVTVHWGGRGVVGSPMAGPTRTGRQPPTGPWTVPTGETERIDIGLGWPYLACSPDPG